MVEQVVQPASPHRRLPRPTAHEVDDDSMAGAGIHRGDWLLFELTSETGYEPEDGEIVVLWHERYFVPRTFRRYPARVEAQAAVEGYEPVVAATTAELPIMGRFAGLIRVAGGTVWFRGMK